MFTDLQANNVQGVMFLTPGRPQEDALGIWSRIFPNDGPDGFQRNNASPSLSSVANGDRDGYIVAVSSTVNRIDIVLNPRLLDQTEYGASIPCLKDVTAATHKVKEILNSLSKSVDIVRTAIILDLAKTVDKHNQISVLRSLMPDCSFPEGATDIALQFNLRTKFVFDDTMEMNRICSWAAGQLSFVAPMINQGAFTQTQFLFSGVKIDVNSEPEKSLSQENISLALEEIASELLEIYNTGYTRLLG